MEKFRISFIFVALTIILSSCYTPQKQKYVGESESTQTNTANIEVSNTVEIPRDGSAPIVGIEPRENSDQVITFRKVGERYVLKNGQNANFIYDGIDPEQTYIIYEQTFDGYNLELAYRNEPVSIGFSTLCQTYIVASPRLTSVQIPDNLRYEQVVWTPRKDGTWEIRIGATERGCKSRALDELSKLRSRDYEKNVPKR